MPMFTPVYASRRVLLSAQEAEEKNRYIYSTNKYTNNIELPSKETRKKRSCQVLLMKTTTVIPNNQLNPERNNNFEKYSFFYSQQVPML